MRTITPAGLPGLRGVEHVGFTVPDLDEATRFFVEVIGCEYAYSIGPIEGRDDWMSRHLNVPDDCTVRELRFFRCGFGPNFEIFEYEGDGLRITPPRNCDIGGHHLAFYVDDFKEAFDYLARADGVKILGTPTVRTDGPSAGQSWIYFLTPWGMQLELVSFPRGKGYEESTEMRLWHPAYPSR